MSGALSSQERKWRWKIQSLRLCKATRPAISWWKRDGAETPCSNWLDRLRLLVQYPLLAGHLVGTLESGLMCGVYQKSQKRGKVNSNWKHLHRLCKVFADFFSGFLPLHLYIQQRTDGFFKTTCDASLVADFWSHLGISIVWGGWNCDALGGRNMLVMFDPCLPLYGMTGTTCNWRQFFDLVA